MTRENFIREYGQIAIDTTKGTNLLPSIVVAQAILESSNPMTGGVAESQLAQQYNNLFGIKAEDGYDGDKVFIQTFEYMYGNYVTTYDYFRVYDNPKKSFYDRYYFLLNNPRYAVALKSKTPEEQATALQLAGYATDPLYAQKLLSIINSENLETLDIKKMRQTNTELIISVVSLVLAIYSIYKIYKSYYS